jgi:hypothetical protein
MLKLYRSTAELDGTAYFELLPGPYRESCWGPDSVFLDEEGFGFVEPVFVKLCPKFDHYAFTEIGRPLWRDILRELDALADFLRGAATDEQVRAIFGLFVGDTEETFFARPTENRKALREMIENLTGWVRAKLHQHNVVSVLGL